MHHIAKLDDGGVYWGVQEVAALAEGDVEVPADLDLRQGAYKWNREHARFDPLLPGQVRKLPGGPTLEEAFYDFLTIGPAAPRVQAWASWFRASLDGKEPI